MKGLKLFAIFFVCIAFFIGACKDKPSAAKPVPEIKSDTQARMPLDSPQRINNIVYPGVDVSPMDMSYFPVDYPKIKIASASPGLPMARLIYSRPHLEHRKLFEGILKYEQPWRLGANESTEIQFFQPATIQGNNIAPGRYIMYCIPHPDKWTIVFNNNVDTWGLKQDSTKDVKRFEIPVKDGNPTLQYFTMIFEKTDTGADLIIAWENYVGRLPIAFQK